MLTAPARRPTGAGARRRRWDAWWVAGAVLPLLVVSDWKWRTRAADSAIGGSADAVVVLEIAVYASVALWLALRFRWRPGGGRVDGLWLLVWAFSGITALAAVWSPFLSLGVVRGAQLLVITAVGQSIARHATRAQLHRLGHAFLALVGLGVVLGFVYQPADAQGAAVTRFTWLAVHPVMSATYMSMALLLCAAYVVSPGLRAQGPRRWPVGLHLALGALIAYGMFDNRTRGALAGLLVGLLVLAFERVRRRDTPAVLVGVGLTGLVVAAVLGSRLVAYVERGEGADNLKTLNYRTELWGYAVDAWSQSPLAGRGTGATRGVFLEATGLGGGHNAFFNVLVDTGVVGALLWVGLLVALGRRLWTLPRGGDRPLLLALYVALVLNGFTTEGLGASANVSMVLLLVLVGWVSALDRLRREARPAPQVTA